MKEFEGSCHCGKIRYKANIDVSQGSFKCNCTICTKARNWLVGVKNEDFKLISGENDLSDYQRGGNIHFFFCKHCGVRPFGRGKDHEGNDMYAVYVAALDNIDFKEFMNAPIKYYDGRHDQFVNPPEYTAHL
jgi:hypothetical protein